MSSTSGEYDYIVVGLGGHGSAICYNLAKSGCNVLGIEQYGLNHGLGSSYGKSRIIRQAYFEDPFYVPLLKRSFTLWRQLQDEYRQRCNGGQLLHMTGGLMIGKRNSNVVLGTIKSAQEHNLEHEILNAAEIKRRFAGIFHADESVIGVFEKEAGYLVPELCIEAHILLAQMYGATCRFEETMRSWNASENRVQITTNKGVYSAKKVVFAVGAWAPQIYGNAVPPSINLRCERRVLYWFDPCTSPAAGKLLNDPSVNGNIELRNKKLLSQFQNIPVYIWENGEDHSNFYGFPYPKDGQTQRGYGYDGVKVAIHIAPQSLCTADTINRNVTLQETNFMKSILSQHMPLLAGDVVSTSTCLYTSTNDEHFLIDWHPSHRNVLLCSPCSGHGYKFCSVIGEICAQLLRTNQTTHNIRMFSMFNRGKIAKNEEGKCSKSGNCQGNIAAKPDINTPLFCKL